MAGTVGQFLAPAIWPESNPDLSSDLNALEEVVYVFDFYEASPAVLNSSYGTWRLPAANHRGITAQRKQPSYFDDFYNRIYIVPGSLDVGNLLSTQQRHVVLWNAYLTAKTLESAAAGPQSGVSLTPPSGMVFPYEMAPLREVDFVVRVDLAGPPTINTSVSFTVEGLQYVVPIVGRRIVLFPFPPTWSSPFDETITHRSWVIESENGDEQTGSESGEIPRRTFEFSVNLRNAKQAQRCENLLFAWQARFFGVPHWGEESRLSSEALEGDSSIAFDTQGLSFEPGSLVAIYLNEDKNEIREIGSVSAGGVTLTSGTQYNWPEGSRVYPCFVALLNDAVTGNRETSRVGRVPVTFDCEPSVTPGNTPRLEPPINYRGYELYLGKINWKSALPFTFKSDVQRVDSNAGKFTAYTWSGFSKFSRKHNWTMYNRAEIYDFRKFLGRRQGVAFSTFMPSGNDDFNIAAPALAADSALIVEKNEYGNLAGAHPARRDIIIRFVGGAYMCRRIESTEDFSTFTRLIMAVPFGIDINTEDVEQISFLSLYRLESASSTIRYLTDSKAISELSLVVKKTEN